MKELEFFFENQINEHQRIAEKSRNLLLSAFVKTVTICSDSLKDKKKLLFFGNGGSAADAQHLSTELSVRFSKNRTAISAISLVTDTSTISAIGNDLGFDHLFSRQIEAIGNAGDVAIGISTSGKSENVINGLKKAKQMGLKCLALTGKHTKDVDKLCDQVISIPADNTSRIQEMHIMIGQMLCNAIEFKLGLATLVVEEE